ncbi:MAG: hypothetical protein HYX63_00365 [Gammaproteobacteria bacterium]|nr:hypothetical protein [Gammaproteobacteria bacterium]
MLLTMNRFLVAGLLYSMTVYSAQPPSFTPPPFLSGPTISRAAFGNTFSYRGDVMYPNAALQITVSEFPPGLPHTDTTVCIEAFLVELLRADPNLFIEPSTFTLRSHDLTFDAKRWTQTTDHDMATGVVACAVRTNHFVAVNFRDSVRAAPRSFAAIRTALSNSTLP